MVCRQTIEKYTDTITNASRPLIGKTKENSVLKIAEASGSPRIGSVTLKKRIGSQLEGILKQVQDDAPTRGVAKPKEHFNRLHDTHNMLASYLLLEDILVNI